MQRFSQHVLGAFRQLRFQNLAFLVRVREDGRRWWFQRKFREKRRIGAVHVERRFEGDVLDEKEEKRKQD